MTLAEQIHADYARSEAFDPAWDRAEGWTTLVVPELRAIWFTFSNDQKMQMYWHINKLLVFIEVHKMDQNL